MKVYVVIEDYIIEGYEILKVFSNREKANDFEKELKLKNRDKYIHYLTQEWEVE